MLNTVYDFLKAYFMSHRNYCYIFYFNYFTFFNTYSYPHGALGKDRHFMKDWKYYLFRYSGLLYIWILHIHFSVNEIGHNLVLFRFYWKNSTLSFRKSVPHEKSLHIHLNLVILVIWIINKLMISISQQNYRKLFLSTKRKYPSKTEGIT